jgi:transposase
VEACNKEGYKSLSYQKRGVKSEDRKLLNKYQVAIIQKMIIDVMPDQLKLDYALWTIMEVSYLIASEFSITIGIRAFGSYLKAW